jgi:hypothetical protein
MDSEIVKYYLKKIEETNTLELKEKNELRFHKVYEGLLFNTIIPQRRNYLGLYKLTVQGKTVLNSGRNQ